MPEKCPKMLQNGLFARFCGFDFALRILGNGLYGNRSEPLQNFLKNSATLQAKNRKKLQLHPSNYEMCKRPTKYGSINQKGFNIFLKITSRSKFYFCEVKDG